LNRRGIVIEACVGSVEDAVLAAELGADRLEFCSSLVVGGLTPTVEELREVQRRVRTPVMAMARPSACGFTECDSKAIFEDAVRMFEAGADGLVFGSLTPDGRINEPLVREVVELAGRRYGTRVVFHKAFDQSADLEYGFERLVRLGVDRVLTSGGAVSALSGCDALKRLVNRSRAHVLVGGGVRADNVAEILHETKAREIHSACRSVQSETWRFDSDAFARLIEAVRRFESSAMKS
jgi:copper homeostasis protein